MKCRSLWMCCLFCSLCRATSLWAGRSWLDMDAPITTLYDSVYMDWHLIFAVLVSIRRTQTINAINKLFYKPSLSKGFKYFSFETESIQYNGFWLLFCRGTDLIADSCFSCFLVQRCRDSEIKQRKESEERNDIINTGSTTLLKPYFKWLNALLRWPPAYFKCHLPLRGSIISPEQKNYWSPSWSLLPDTWPSAPSLRPARPVGTQRPSPGDVLIFLYCWQLQT